MVRVYADYYMRKYYARVCSCASFCCVLAFVATIVVPFLLAYLSREFWVKTNIYYEQPRVSFNGSMYMSVMTPNATSIYSSNNRINQLHPGLVLTPVVEVLSEDVNSDGLNDLLTFTATVPTTVADIRRVDLIIGLDLELLDLGKMVMSGAVFTSFSSAMGIGTIQADGLILLRQRLPLGVSKDKKWLYAGENLFATLESFSYSGLLDQYLTRNQSLQYQHSALVRPARSGDLQIICTMRIPTQQVLYQPDMLEVFKFAWIQYLSLLLPFYFITYYGVLWLAYRYGVFSTSVAEDHAISKLAKPKPKQD